MQLGMIGLRRMGANMVRRLIANQVLSAMRQEFGSHVEKAADKAGTK